MGDFVDLLMEEMNKKGILLVKEKGGYRLKGKVDQGFLIHLQENRDEIIRRMERDREAVDRAMGIDWDKIESGVCEIEYVRLTWPDGFSMTVSKAFYDFWKSHNAFAQLRHEKNNHQRSEVKCGTTKSSPSLTQSRLDVT